MSMPMAQRVLSLEYEPPREKTMRTFLPTTILTATLSLLATSNDIRATCKPPATCDNAPAWKEGAKYKKGDRVIGARGNLWECKGGDLTKLCDDKGREPDIDAAASEAWELIQSCFVIEVPEVSTTDVSVSSTQCPSAITLTAVIANDSPFGGLSVPVAFYHSASKTLIGVAQVELAAGEGGPGFSEVSMIWNNPLPDSALITVVADDDGTGHGILLETNETDNALATTLVTCPSL
jgi:hypothetical protein